MKDHNGRDVVGPEAPDTPILVWEITPHYDPRYDYLVERGYQAAKRAAGEVVERLMENLSDEPGEIAEEDCTIRIRLVQMTFRQYEEITAD
jgi:hypothetical protein